MELVIPETDPDYIDIDSIAHAVAEVARRVPDPDAVKVVFTLNFEESVREHVADKNYAENYKADRMGGLAVGKTIGQDDSKNCTILVNAAFALRGEDIDASGAAQTLRRLLAHEALHAAVHQRQEESNNIRSRLQLPDPLGTFAAIAGVLVAEYRVERALCDEGWWPSWSYSDGVLELLDAFRSQILEGVTMESDDEPIDRCLEVVLSRFHEVTTQLGYVAAEHIASNGSRFQLPLADPRWGRFVGPHWAILIHELKVVPSATSDFDRDLSDGFVMGIAKILPDFLNYIGFDWYPVPDGTYFQALTHDF